VTRGNAEKKNTAETSAFPETLSKERFGSKCNHGKTWGQRGRRREGVTESSQKTLHHKGTGEGKKDKEKKPSGAPFKPGQGPIKTQPKKECVGKRGKKRNETRKQRFRQKPIGGVRA